MTRVRVEFIHTCPCCDEYGPTIQAAASRYGDRVEVRIYHAGRDFDYLKTYGPVTRGR